MLNWSRRQVVHSLSASWVAMALAFGSTATTANELPAPLQAKVEKYKKQLVEWAAHPTMVAAVKEANAKGGPIAGMNNAKWNDLDEKDPVVTASLTSPAGNLIRKWEDDKNINKLFLRDQKGQLIAGSSKSLLYNASARPSFQQAMKGQAWGDKEIKPDPTTQIKSVQISAPVLDGGTPIGILHSSVTAE